jgi:hypothetical protein
MSPSRADILLAPLAHALLLAGCCLAQTPAPADEPAEPAAREFTREATLAGYLDGLGLHAQLAEYLRDRIEKSSGPQRVEHAERLAKLYVKLLEAKTDPAERERLERDSRALLDAVPDADSFALRLDLARAAYRPAEEIAERDQAGMTTPQERTEAIRVLRSQLPVFAGIAGKLQERVADLERRADGAADASEPLRELLGESRRLRSLARYYEGWTRLYLAGLERTPADAEEALRAFGWILNAVPGKLPSIDRAPRSTMAYEHVARAMMGVSIAHGLRGDATEALRWLEELEAMDDPPAAVAEQFFARKFVILARARRWADATALVQRRRNATGTKEPTPLPPHEARLVTALAMESARAEDMREGLRQGAAELAKTALADLIARGEIGQLVQLLQRFGTLPIGNDGALVSYIRGVEKFEAARAAHRAASPPGETPATDAGVVNLYRDAAGLLESAFVARDEPALAGERPNALMRLGLSRYFAGDMPRAIAAFEACFAATRTTGKHTGTLETLHHDALWYATVAADAWARSEPTPAQSAAKRDALTGLFLANFPDSPHAPRLLLTRARAGAGDDAQAVEILLRVEPSSPIYGPSRREAARLLYAMRRSARPADRDALALRFLLVAEDSLRADRAAAMGQASGAAAAAKSGVILARQIAEVSLSLTPADAPRARAALQALDDLLRRHNLPQSQSAPDADFRWFQIALLEGDGVNQQRLHDKLRAAGGAYAAAADALHFRALADRWKSNRADVDAARALVRLATALHQANAGDRATIAQIRDAGAAAAMSVWENAPERAKESAIAGQALELDRAQLKAGVRTIASLRRVAILSEALNTGEAGRRESLDAWSELLTGFDAGTDAWYEARYHSLRLLLELDPAAGARVYDQFKVLHTGIPEKWAGKFAALKIPAQAPAPGKKDGR